jgi:hypothetical protein
MAKNHKQQFSARVTSVGLAKNSAKTGRPTVEVGFSSTLSNGRDKRGPVPLGFDVWTSTPDEMHAWVISGEIAVQNPAYAQWAAATVIKDSRRKIETNGPALLQAISMVAKQGLVMPKWMADVYITRFLRVERLEVGSLDEAFGPLPFKPGQMLKNQRRRRELIPKISSLMIDALNKNPTRPIDRGLFDEIGEIVAQSGSYVEKAYYEGVREHGMQDVERMKALKLFPYK